MKVASGLREGRFGERLNRFLARVEVDGKETLAHVPNSGRMRELFVPGATVYVSPAVTSGRKTAFDLCLVLIDGVLVSCDSRLPPSLVAEAQILGRLAEFAGYPVIERERTFGESRLDLCFSGPRGRVYVETKSATLVCGGRALFPDAPTMRGTKHVRTLMKAVDEGTGRRWYSWCRGTMRPAFRRTGMRTRSSPRRCRRRSGRESGCTHMGVG